MTCYRYNSKKLWQHKQLPVSVCTSSCSSSQANSDFPNQAILGMYCVQKYADGVMTTKRARRPWLWHGNVFKAFYWACVGQSDALDRKVAKAKQQLADIQNKDLKNTGGRAYLLHCLESRCKVHHV